MNDMDKTFDINMVLMVLFSSLKTIKDRKNIELIYEINSTVPKELRGDASVLLELLTHILIFVFENSKKREIILSLSAPEDFLYEESISFEIRETGINKLKIENFLQNELKKDIELLNGKSIEENKNLSAVSVSIPFKLNELGKRRYYRLPNKIMLNKKVLLICKSFKLSKSIEKMFKYFLYDVTVGLDAYKREGSNLRQYDIFLIEEKFITKELEAMIEKVQKDIPFKYVVLQNSYHMRNNNRDIKSVYLIKPVIQESIFELIISLFEDKSIKSNENKTVINMTKYVNEDFNKITKDKISQSNTNDTKKANIEIESIILNLKAGEINAIKMRVSYDMELNKFLESFNHSDIYFRQIINENSTWKIKEFCIELEKQAKFIGAESMLKFADSVSLLFVYDQLDKLPTYTGKYYLELKKLITEIKVHLNALKR